MSSLSHNVVNQQGDTLVSFERVATITQTSVTTIYSFVRLGIVEPEGSMLRLEDIVVPINFRTISAIYSRD